MFKVHAEGCRFNVQDFYAEKPCRGPNLTKPNVLNALEYGVILYPKEMCDFSFLKLETRPKNVFGKKEFGGKKNWTKNSLYKYMKNPFIFGHFLTRYGQHSEMKIVELFAGSASTYLFAKEFNFPMEFVEKDKDQTDKWKTNLEGDKSFDLDFNEIPYRTFSILSKDRIDDLKKAVEDDESSTGGNTTPNPR